MLLQFEQIGEEPIVTSDGRTVLKVVRVVGISKRATCHRFRHSFATHLLADCYDLQTVQELMGHKDVRTTMIYTQVLNRGALGVRSPLDVPSGGGGGRGAMRGRFRGCPDFGEGWRVSLATYARLDEGAGLRGWATAGWGEWTCGGCSGRRCAPPLMLAVDMTGLASRVQCTGME